MIKPAHIVFLPYSYLTTKKFRITVKEFLKNSIIIFDEGHNVGTCCEEGSSIDLSLDSLTRVREDFTALRRAFETHGNRLVAENIEANYGYIRDQAEIMKNYLEGSIKGDKITKKYTQESLFTFVHNALTSKGLYTPRLGGALFNSEDTLSEATAFLENMVQKMVFDITDALKTLAKETKKGI